MAVSLTLFFVVTSASAQDQSQTQNPPQTDENAKPKQDAPPEAGGPGGDIGPYAIPKKNAEEPPPPPPPPTTPNKVEGLPWERPSEEVCEAFLDSLEKQKVIATLRREKGHDIDAACGQLRLKTEKELTNATG